MEYIEVDPNHASDTVIYITSSVYQNGLLDIYKYGMGLFKTNDGGDNWTELSDGINPVDEMYLRCVRVKPGNSNYVFACGKNKVYRSTNAGANWSVVRTGNDNYSPPNIRL